MVRRETCGLGFWILGFRFSIFHSLPVCWIAILLSAAPAWAVIHHKIDVTLYPGENRFEASDVVSFRDPDQRKGMEDIRFRLHPGLDPRRLESSTPLERVRTGRDSGSYIIEPVAGETGFAIQYGGVINHPLQAVGEEYARGQQDTVGSIGPEGVYLDGGSGWYPRLPGDERITFDLTVNMPAGWSAVSQGTRTRQEQNVENTVVRWVSDAPQGAIWLLAGRYREYLKQVGDVTAMVFLREPDEDLAGKYLEATGEYVGMYERLIGKYPYGKFALVENFWETGYGMPSFTLLGPRIIRFPFIIESSYPHEILHNWWGNSVFIDYGAGNWGEGLTAYLSDHLLKEQKGQGGSHRQETLQKYADYVLQGRDIPLTAFRSRHGSVTEAVGYGKTLMVFHMLRLAIGDDLFREGLRRFYADNLYRTADWQDLKLSFEQVSDQDLDWFFDQWVERTGSPRLELEGVRSESRDEGGYRLSMLLRQVQPGDAYRMGIPVAVTMEGQKDARQLFLEMKDKEQTFELPVRSRPLRVDVDPEFDLFRRLDRREVPPALTQAFGAEKAVIVLPAEAEPDLLESYRSLAQFLVRTGPGGVKIYEDKSLEGLPTDASVWILGWENRLLAAIRGAFADYGLTFKGGQAGGVSFDGPTGTVLERDSKAVVLAGRHPGNPDLAVLWIAADNPAAHAGLARKLPHYHKYSYLGFQGDEPDNVVKGRWPVVGSPLTNVLDGETDPGGSVPMADLAAREPVIDRPVPWSRGKMVSTVSYLAADDRKGRGFGTPELKEVSEYIAQRFREYGLEPGGGEPGSYFQEWTGPGGELNLETSMRNVVGVVRGTDAGWRGQSVVVGAHYDHLGMGWPGGLTINRGRIHPGADDNASGVAVLLELARVMAGGERPKRSVVFVAFAGEEDGKRGSKYYTANAKKYPAEGIMGMVNLDTVGRLEEGSLLVLGASSAADWVHIFRGAGYVAGVDVRTVDEDLDSSDHISFQEAGAPAVQLFTGAHADYHKPGDTADKVDLEGMIKVAAVAREAVDYLAGREEPLTSSTGPTREKVEGEGLKGKSERKVFLGTIPDFGFEGNGVRIDGTVPGSPAAEADLKQGDVIVEINGQEIGSLRDYSAILKSLEPGDVTDMVFLRGDEEMGVQVKTRER
ncbi:MAG: M20/M25/M40 family metallo-hydrolase [bacterium]|nr:MAG: M20/M25/M40 family metallo-hydrolase [bacterium]